MVYANPIEEELASGKYYDRLGTPFYLSPDKLQSDYAPVRFERELRLFRKYCPQGSVLDVGCSTGAFLYQLGKTGAYQTTGTDVASEALDHAASQGIKVIRESFLTRDFADTRYDAITFWAVLEHLAEPAEFIQKALGLLKPGGHCFILVPNVKSLAIRICGSKYRYVMPDHLNYFSAAHMQSFVCGPGPVETVHIGSSHFNPIVIWQDLRGGANRVADADRAKLLKKTTAMKQKPWLRPVKFLYRMAESGLNLFGLGDNLVLVVRKLPTC